MWQKGFTIIEVIVLLAVTAILAGGIITFVFQAVNKERRDKTLEQLSCLKKAVASTPRSFHYGGRTPIGYFEDMGMLPSKLEDLYIKGSQPSYSFSPSLKVGVGWNGPYLDPKVIEYLDSLKKDGFGQPFQYLTTSFVDTDTGETVEGKIISPGKDGKVDTPDDLSVEFFTNELYSEVSGFIKDADGKGVGDVSVTINFPNKGALASSTSITDSYGFYKFQRVPHGIHSLQLAPKLILASGSGHTRDNGSIVVLTVVNTSAVPISLSSLNAVYSINPPSYYEKVYIGDMEAFKWNTKRVGSGEAVHFSPVTIPGATVHLEAIPLQVEPPVTEVPDIFLTTFGSGSAVEVRLEGFNSSYEEKGGEAVNMSGVHFVITLSNGSMITFTP